jgi:hypothetical protein
MTCTDASAADDVRHHFSRFLDEEIANLRNALEKQSNFAGLPKLKGFDRQHANWATDGVFILCSDMPRLDLAFAALKRLSCGTLPAEQSQLDEEISRTREKLGEVRKRFYPPACYIEQRLRTNLAEIIGPLCDELEGLVIVYYTVVKSHYGLPELDDTGKKQ